MVAFGKGLAVGHTASSGRKRSPEYVSWQSMIARCTRESHPHFADYGGRGIRVSDLWRHSFAQFFADLGPRPEGMTLDRSDPDGDYEPANCRWATLRQQRWNRRDMVRDLIEPTPDDILVGVDPFAAIEPREEIPF
jgi:hypothetical protein